jgi:hypothetical protein
VVRGLEILDVKGFLVDGEMSRTLRKNACDICNEKMVDVSTVSSLFEEAINFEEIFQT